MTKKRKLYRWKAWAVFHNRRSNALLFHSSGIPFLYDAMDNKLEDIKRHLPSYDIRPVEIRELSKEEMRDAHSRSGN